MSWLRWRHQRRIDAVEACLPLDADTPEYVLSAVAALADAGRGHYDRQEVRNAVWRARMARVSMTTADFYAAALKKMFDDAAARELP